MGCPKHLRPPSTWQGTLPVTVVEAVEDVLHRPAALGDVEVFVGHQLGDGKTVVELHHADLFPRVLDARLLVGLGLHLSVVMK